MLVFKEALTKRGSVLPLPYYLQPHVEPRPGMGPGDFPATTVDTTINRKSFFQTVLHDKDFPTVTAFLLGGLDANTRRSLDGATALHVAVAGTDAPLSHVLPNEVDAIPPSLFERSCPNQLIISFLLDNGADVNVRAANGETALMVAAAAQNIRAMKLLLAKGAAVDLEDNQGRTCLAFAALHPHVMQALEVWVGMAELSRIARKGHLLHHVCRHPGSNYAALFLIEQIGMDVDGKDSSASEQQTGDSNNNNNNNDIVKDNKAIAEVAVNFSPDNAPPLHVAITTGDVDLVKALLSKSADITAVDSCGTSAVELAKRLSSRRRVNGNTCVDHAAVKRLVTKFAKEVSGVKRENMLNSRPTSIFALGGDVIGFLLFFLFPPAAIYLYCIIMPYFYGLLLVLFAMVAMYTAGKRTDMLKTGMRPLRLFGFAAGLVVAQALCLPVYTTRFYYTYYSFEQDPHLALTHWLIPSAVASALLLLYVMLASPHVVSSTAGQRKGIYASIASAKGAPSKELINSVDLTSMVKKPLRAQYCAHVKAVVLYFDHYCAYLSSPIGAHNIRAFFLLHVAFLSLLSSFYFYACGYYRVLMEGVDVFNAMASVSNAQPMPNIHMSNTFFRFGYVYTQLILPFMMVFVVLQLFTILSLSGRALSRYDVDHADTTSSAYCFKLDETVYSLFDEGYFKNWFRFLWAEKLDAVVHRVPKMNNRLQKIVEDHQRWKMNPGGCCGNDHDHDHGHGGHQNPQAMPLHHHQDGVTVGPAEVGDDEAYVAKQRLQHAFDNARESAVAVGNNGSSSAAVAPAAPAAGGGAPALGAANNLAQHIFREMIRNKSDDIGPRGAAGGGGGGVDSQTQQEWDDAVAQARTMYAFFQRSMQATMPSGAPQF